MQIPRRRAGDIRCKNQSIRSGILRILSDLRDRDEDR